MAGAARPNERVLEEYLEKTERKHFIAGAVTVGIAGVVIVALAVLKYLWEETSIPFDQWVGIDRTLGAHILNLIYLVVDGAAKATIVLSVAFTLVLRSSVRNIIRQVIQIEDDTQKISTKDPFHLDPQTGDWIKQWGDAGYRQEIERLTAENQRLRSDAENDGQRLNQAFATLIEQIRNLKDELSRREN